MVNWFKEIWKVRVFIITSLFFIILGAFILFTQEKVDIHLTTNAINSQFLDTFFKYWTYLGDGLLAPIIVLILGIVYFKKNGYTTFLIGFSTLLTSGILSQVLKRSFFSGSLRPLGVIGPEQLYLIEGVDVHTFHSFPSGHTTLGFAFMAFVAYFYFSKNRWIQFALALIAVLIGYSRIHLSQHFLEDVVTGALLGLLSLIIVLFVQSLFSAKKVEKPKD